MDGFDLLHQLAPSSLDLIVTDPPYGVTNLAYDKNPPDWDRLFDLCFQKLKPGCPLVMFSQKPLSARLIAANESLFHYDIIWKKRYATRFLDAKRLPLRAHEEILVFARGFPRYFPQKRYVGKQRSSRVRGNQRSGSHYNHAGTPEWHDDGYRYPTSVLEFNEPDKTKSSTWQHPNRKPLKLIEFLVASYSLPDDLVCDVFLGSGTAAVACRNLGRNFIGSEMDREYAALAGRRLRETDPYLASHSSHGTQRSLFETMDDAHAENNSLDSKG